MRNFQDTFETRKRPFISGFSICMTVPLSFYQRIHKPSIHASLTFPVSKTVLATHVVETVFMNKIVKGIH